MSSLVFGPPWPSPSPADSASSVLVAGTTRGFIPLYNMRYPLLVNLWQQSDAACVDRMALELK